nr:hypothetical protein [Candidatus Sigynarchaeota archaeon]
MYQQAARKTIYLLETICVLPSTGLSELVLPAMHVIEIGFLFNEAPLVHVGFYRDNETLNDATKKAIFLGIHGMLSEIFSDNQLNKMQFEAYTVLFQIAIAIYRRNDENRLFNDPV